MTLIHQIIFFDINKDYIEIYKKILSNINIPNLQFKHINFKDLITTQKIQIAISPANSYLSMTGGIDKLYVDLFPNIEDILRKKMIEKKYAKSTIVYKNSNYILPIGKSILGYTNDKICSFIMASTTMIMPKDITGTNNIYLCMKAILKKIIRINIPIIIACPCLGTGIGNLPAEESAKQIKKAFLEIG